MREDMVTPRYTNQFERETLQQVSQVVEVSVMDRTLTQTSEQLPAIHDAA